MKRFRKYTFPAAVAAILAVTLTLAAPRAVHAVTAALVNVTNTAASPAITAGVNRLASQNVFLTGSPGTLATGQVETLRQEAPDGSVSGSSFVVPAGQSLVVTNIEVMPMSSGTWSLEIHNFSSGNYRYTLPNLASGQLTQFQFATGIVFPAGESVAFGNTTLGFFTGSIFVHGYLTSN
jgi:hypothetical protein